jgi:phosphoribosyl-ATP pyrophosphohydrolase
MAVSDILEQIYDIIIKRKEALPQGSYTAKLFREGEDAILKKIGEEGTEVLLASKAGREEGLVHEVADLLFHTLVLLAYHGTPPHAVLAELERRFGTPGENKKRH